MKMYAIKIAYQDGTFIVRYFSNWRDYEEEWSEYMNMYCYDKEIRVTGYTISSRKYRKA